MNNQNETPFGNPKFLMALAITFFGLWGWQYYISKQYPTKTIVAAQTSATNTAQKEYPATANSQDVKNVTGESADVSPQLSAGPSEKTFDYEDDQVKFQITSVGFGIRNFILKKYTDRAGHQISFDENQSQGSIKIDKQITNFTITKNSDTEYAGVANINGKNVSRKLIFNKDTNSFVSELDFDSGFEKVEVQLSQTHHQDSSSSFFNRSFEQQEFVFSEAGSIKSQNITGLKPNEGFLKTSPAAPLASIGSQYFTAAVINKSDIVPALTNKVENGSALVSLEYSLKDTKINKISQLIFLGPKKPDLLSKIDPQLSEVLNYGMFGFIAKPLLQVMAFLHSFLGNWGLAIIALTLIVRTILLPFNVMSFKSAQAMQKLKPKLDSLRVRYKDDPMRMNKETMAVMKENNANPLSGCLPMLLQIPIFFALWKAIGSSIDIYQQPFFGWITDLSYHDPLFIFPILMGITMFLQQKLTPTTMDPMQAKILNFMPIIFTLFMLNLPSGLTLYNFVSALFGVIQQYFLLKDKKIKTPQLV